MVDHEQVIRPDLRRDEGNDLRIPVVLRARPSMPRALRDAGRSFLVITHYQRLLDHIRPDVVHIMADGKIVKSGGPELALEVEHNGYADILAEVA